MDMNKILELANQVTDQIIDEVDAKYNSLETTKGVYLFEGEHQATWVHRMTTLFRNDGFKVTDLGDGKIYVQDLD